MQKHELKLSEIRFIFFILWLSIQNQTPDWFIDVIFVLSRQRKHSNQHISYQFHWLVPKSKVKLNRFSKNSKKNITIMKLSVPLVLILPFSSYVNEEFFFHNKNKKNKLNWKTTLKNFIWTGSFNLESKTIAFDNCHVETLHFWRRTSSLEIRLLIFFCELMRRILFSDRLKEL